MKRFGLFWLMDVFVFVTMMCTSSLTSCTKVSGAFQENASGSSSGISFTASSAYDATTKTTYTNQGTTSSDGNLSKERIDWVGGDLIRIVSAQAKVYDKNTSPWTLVFSNTSPQYSLADYRVSPPKEESDVVSRATIAPVGGNGLQWGTGNHTFYAMYPSRETAGYTAAEKAKIGINHEKMMATIPSAQSPDLSKAKGWPDMRYAYMFGSATAAAGATSVNLPFYPEFTAFEFTISKGENASVELTSFTLETTAADGKLTGDFTLTNASGWNSAVTTANTSKQLTVDLGGVTLNDSKPSLTFTVLGLPVNLTSMQLVFTGPALGTRTLELKDKSDNPLNFTARKKYRIYGMSFPAGLSSEGEDILWDLEAWGEEVLWETGIVLSDLNSTASIGYDGGTVTLASDFKSYMQDSAADMPVSFGFEWSDNGTDWLPGLPDWMSVDSSVDMNGSVAGQELKLKVAPQEDSYVNPHTTELRSRAAKTNFDLSTVNVATGQTVSRTTANCYVVDAPGSYRFPAVYGNGVKDGAVNEAAYMSIDVWDLSGAHHVSTGSTIPEDGLYNQRGVYLGRFYDHMDRLIASPYIATQHAGKSFSVELLWTDEPGLVQNVSLAGSGEQMYIAFDVPSSSIRQGNAGIALKADGIIAWSWHIWVTDSDLKAVEGDGYSISPENVGWCSRRDIQYDARTAYVRAVNAAGGSSAVSKVEQTAATFRYSGENPLFQFGRKDPIVPQRYLVNKAGNTNQQRFNKTVYGLSYQTVSGQKISIGQSIQRPDLFPVALSAPSTVVDFLYAEGTVPNLFACQNIWASNITDGFTTPGFDQFSNKTIYDPSPVGYRVMLYGTTAVSASTHPLDIYNTEYRYVVSTNAPIISMPLSGNFFTKQDGSTVETNVGVICEFWSAFPNLSLFSSNAVTTISKYNARYFKFDRNLLSSEGGNMSTAPSDMKWTGKSVRPVFDNQ